MPYCEPTAQSIRAWPDRTFSFTLGRPQDLAFQNGEFATIGLKRDASPDRERGSELFPIQVRRRGVPDCPLPIPGGIA